ncbi:SSI family serine proteinase inhibitor [Streptomyces cupreus]|uniref:Serine protease n=1 Tax=Streptomyces cupreus TaxID=2759956 RepID=A0A7X1M8C2_9ACTN|nr:SSI family serine proteinase inhibitor [Streptomyces cupreus]MBC2902064.1 serine protease [Streptomyces cupreus]
MTHSTTVKAGRAGARGVLLAVASLLVLAAVPAHSAERETFPGNWLYLTLTTGNARSGDTRGTLLMCNPPLGHASAAEACAELAAVEGDIDRMTQKDTLCPMIYAPVSVKARGHWNGRPVEYRRTFDSACRMEAWTGVVFALDD